MADYAASPLLSKAIGFLQSGDLDSSFFFVTSYLDMNPEDPDAYNLAGVVKLKQSLFDESIEFLSKAIELNASVSLYHVNLGNAFVGAEKYEKARKSFLLALELEPDLSAALCSLGNVLAIQGEFEASVKYFQKAIKINPDSDAYRGFSVALQKKKSYEKAVEMAYKAVSLVQNDVECWENLGIALLKNSEPENAEKAFKKAIEIRPDFANAWNNLAIIQKDFDNLKDAEYSIRQCLLLTPDNATSLSLFADILVSLNRDDEAVSVYEKAISLSPNHVNANNNLALILQDRGDIEKSLLRFEKAFKSAPDNVFVINNYAGVLRKTKKYNKAIALFDKVIALGKADAGIYNNLGLVYVDLKNRKKAIECFEKAISENDELPEAYNNYSALLIKINDIEKAIEMLKQVVKIRPEYLEAWNNLGHAYYIGNKLKKAFDAFNRILEIDPENGSAKFSLGVISWKEKKYSKSLSLIKEAIEKDGKKVCYLNMLGLVSSDIGLAEETKHAYEKILEITEEPIPQIHSNYLFFLHYNPKISNEELFEAHKYWEKVNSVSIKDTDYPHMNNRNPERPLRIGYVSGDFRSHSVSYFSLPIIEGHHKSEFETYCYSNSRTEDEQTIKTKKAVNHWRDIVGLLPNEQQQLIREDKIDILVDLSGHTSGNKLPLFACKPAPIQVSYIGYPNTTGLSAMDYRIVDDKTDPVGESDKLNTEKLARMPDSFLCYRPSGKNVPDVAPLPFEKNGYITFGSFNNISKLGLNVVKAWSEILKRVPNSKLLLKSKQLGDETIRERLANEFADCGIQLDRISCQYYAASLYSHLEIYSQIDICLDTFPYNGTTTTCEALWQGVPTLCFNGNRHSARVSKSLLYGVGLEYLVAENENEYIELAVKTAADTEKLSDLRKNLRSIIKASSLCNEERFVTNLEKLYRQMWKDWCKGEATYEIKSLESQEMDEFGFESDDKKDEVSTGKLSSTL
ncbi:MAG: tetratricopeptide repeat protein [Alphaproteobacteria bacterium]|nr:tetratricopeptide repeat protein [Alphaproteobacteria bacterium]